MKERMAKLGSGSMLTLFVEEAERLMAEIRKISDSVEILHIIG